MPTILFSDAVQDPTLLDNFDPADDVLLFTDHTAAQIRVMENGGGITLTAGGQTVSIDVLLQAVTSGTSGFLRFIDGSALLVGDGTAATIADKLANAIGDKATNGDDQVIGLGGNDTLTGGNGDNLLYGNQGNDVITAGKQPGSDTVFGGQGNDVIRYGSADDLILIYGNLGDDLVYGGAGGMLSYAGQGADTIHGGDGDDTVYGNFGDDRIWTGDGENLVFGGGGNDTITADGDGGNRIYGNLDNDLIYGASGDSVLYGGAGDDTIIGGYGEEELHGNSGNDWFRLFGGLGPALPSPNFIPSYDSDGEDTVKGGEGRDTLQFENIGVTLTIPQALPMPRASTLMIDFNADEDMIILAGTSAAQLAAAAYGGGIADSDTRGNLFKGPDIILRGEHGTLTLAGAAGRTLDGGNLVMTDGTVFVFNVGGAAGSSDGGAADDFMIAGDGGDTLIAGAGDDTLIGGEGADLFVFGGEIGEDDEFQGGLGEDTLTLAIGDGEFDDIAGDSVEHYIVAWTGAAGTANLQVTQEGVRYAIDATSLTAGQNLLVGTYYGGTALAIATGTGNDTVFGSDDTLAGDTLAAGDGNDFLTGLLGNDLLSGEAGIDVLDGGEGADTMTGGAGGDRFVFDMGDSGFTPGTVDHITDFNAGEDEIVFFGGGAVFDQRLVDLSATAGLEAAAEAARDASTGIAGGDAVLFVYGGRTYVFANDATANFSPTDDLLVDITGFTGTFGAGNIPADLP